MNKDYNKVLYDNMMEKFKESFDFSAIENSAEYKELTEIQKKEIRDFWSNMTPEKIKDIFPKVEVMFEDFLKRISIEIQEDFSKVDKYKKIVTEKTHLAQILLLISNPKDIVLQAFLNELEKLKTDIAEEITHIEWNIFEVNSRIDDMIEGFIPEEMKPYIPEIKYNKNGNQFLHSQALIINLATCMLTISMKQLETLEIQIRTKYKIINMSKYIEVIYEKYKNTEERLLRLIQIGENSNVEFKETFIYNVRQNEKDDSLAFNSLKTIAAFLNTEGGILFIGVNDNGELNGLERDYSVLGKGKENADDFQQKLVEKIKNEIGVNQLPFLNIKIEKINGLDICVVKVIKSKYPAILKSYKNIEKQRIMFEEFYIRAGNTSHKLSMGETLEYIKKSNFK